MVHVIGGLVLLLLLVLLERCVCGTSPGVTPVTLPNGMTKFIDICYCSKLYSISCRIFQAFLLGMLPGRWGVFAS